MNKTIERHLDKEMDERLLAAFRDLSLRTEGWVRKNMYDLRERATKSEVRVACYLDKHDYHFISQAPFYNKEINAIYFADFLLPRQSLIIEVDGASHRPDSAKANDAIRDSFFQKCGYDVIRISNNLTKPCAVLDRHLGSVLRKLRPPKPKKTKKSKVVTVYNKEQYETTEQYKKYKIVLDSINKAEAGSVLVFRTTTRIVAKCIATKSGGPGKYHGLLEEIAAACKERNVTILAKFDSKKSKEWMGRHLNNPVTQNYIKVMRDLPDNVIDLG